MRKRAFSVADKRRFLSVLRGEIPDRVPNYEVFIGRKVSSYILGKETEDLWRMSPEDAVLLAEKISMDMILTPIGGWDILSSVGKNPNTEKLVREDLKKISKNFLEVSEKSLSRMESLLKICSSKNIGVCASPGLIFDQSVYAIGFEKFFLLLYDDREFIEEVLDVYTEYASILFEKICAYDIAVIHTGDDIAGKSGLFINPDIFRKLWLPRIEKILRFPKEKGIPLIFHSDGNIYDIIPDLINLGFCGINPLEPYSNDIYQIKQEFGHRLTLIGNIDIAGALSFGSIEETIRDVREHLEKLMPGGRYICSSSHSITDAVKPANFLAMIDTIHTYGKYEPTA